MTGGNNYHDERPLYDGEPIEPELLAIARRLDHDGGTWRRGLPEEQRAAWRVITSISNTSPREQARLGAQAPLSGGTPPVSPPGHQGPTRAQRLLAVAAMLAVVILLAALLKAFAPVRHGQHPIATATSTTAPTATSFPGAWSIIASVALQTPPDFAPSDPRIVYEAQMQGPGKSGPSSTSVALRRSDDAGTMWQSLALPPGLVVDNNLLDLQLVVSPFDAQVVFLYSARSAASCTPQGDRGIRTQPLAPRASRGSGGGVCLTQYRSADGGASWMTLALPLPGVIRKVAYDGNGTVYALLAHPLYGSGVEPPERLIASTDVGLTWHVADAPLWSQGYGLAGMAVAPAANADRLVSIWAVTNPVALAQDPQASPRYQLWRSDDGGTTWRLMVGGTLPHQYSPFLIAGAGVLYQLEQQPAPATDATLADQLPAVSTDGGASWQHPPTAGLQSSFSLAAADPVVSGAAIVEPFVDGNGIEFYTWRPGAGAWTQVAPPLQAQQLNNLFIVRTGGHTTLWAIYAVSSTSAVTVASLILA